MLGHCDGLQIRRDADPFLGPAWATWQKMISLNPKPVYGPFLCLGVNTWVGHVPQPDADLCIGGGGIQDQALWLEQAFQHLSADCCAIACRAVGQTKLSFKYRLNRSTLPLVCGRYGAHMRGENP